MDNGWVKIHRKITDWPFWFSEPFSRAQAWIDLILLTNHKQKTIFIRGNEITIERGQTISSIRFLASRWQWGINKTQKFLKNLEKNKQITRRGVHRICTYTTILNYEKYQSEDTNQKIHRQIHRQIHRRYTDGYVTRM